MDYRATMGRATIAITVFSSILLLGISFYLLVSEPQVLSSLAALALIVPPLILFVCYLYQVSSYHLDSKNIVIKRFAPNFYIPVSSIESVEIDNNAMKRSLRIFGNGGLFGFYGRFRNKKYGSYRAFVKDLKKLVVIKTDKKTIIISPDKPEVFVKKLKGYMAKELP